MENEKELGFPIDSEGQGGLLLYSQGNQKAKALRLTSQQLDKVIDVGAKALPEAIDVLKGIVDIARIRAQSNANVETIEAETNRVVQITRVEIDRMRQSGENLRTRGEVVSAIVRSMTETVRALPDFDSQSRLALIESLKDILKLAVHGEA